MQGCPLEPVLRRCVNLGRFQASPAWSFGRPGSPRHPSSQPEEDQPVPKRTDIHKILLIGSGPIIIGQACEFDYSGTQACKALREEGYEVVLVNSNPATIMTDPEMADRTYIEPITWESSPRSSRPSSPTPCCPRSAARPA